MSADDADTAVFGPLQLPARSEERGLVLAHEVAWFVLGGIALTLGVQVFTIGVALLAWRLAP